MTGKRYFKRMWEEEYYIFDSQTISENEFDGKVEYEDYQAFADSMHGDEVINRLNELHEENKELKHYIKKLEKEIFLAHMSSMFSTVKSFNGDVSKRYYYSEETDKIYDTANHYGQYNKILDKKEIAMLLNEYETMLSGDDVE